MDLKHEVININSTARQKKSIREEKKKLLIEKWHNSLMCKTMEKIVAYLDKKEEEMYDRKTEKFMSLLPKILRQSAKIGEEYSDIYIYNFNFLTRLYLTPNLAEKYLEEDKRGLEIFKYLKENKFRVSLIAHNGYMSNYCSIRVYFD